MVIKRFITLDCGLIFVVLLALSPNIRLGWKKLPWTNSKWLRKWVLSHLLRYNIVSCNQLSRIIVGFCDSLQSFRRYFGLQGNSLHDWIRRFNIAEGQSHEAIVDARNLRESVELAAREQNMTVARFINYRKSIQQIIEKDLQ